MRIKERLRTKRQLDKQERLLDGEKVNSDSEDETREIKQENNKIIKGLGSNVYPNKTTNSKLGSKELEAYL